MTEGKKAQRRDDRVSLNPLTLEEALGAAMEVAPPPPRKKGGKRDDAEKPGVTKHGPAREAGDGD